MYLEKLKTYNRTIIDHLADHLILHRRVREGLGLCCKYSCVERQRHNQKTLGDAMVS